MKCYVRVNGKCQCEDGIARLERLHGCSHANVRKAEQDAVSLRKEWPGAEVKIIVGECPRSRERHEK